MSDTLELSKRAPGQEDADDMSAPPPPGVKWRIKVGDKEYGPYPRSRLIDFLKEGRVVASTLLCCGADIEFVRADRFSSKDDVQSFALAKARQIIDEQGNTLFQQSWPSKPN